MRSDRLLSILLLLQAHGQLPSSDLADRLEAVIVRPPIVYGPADREFLPALLPMAKLGGTLQNDILKEYSAQKEFLFPPEPSMRLVVDTIEFGTRHSLMVSELKNPTRT